MITREGETRNIAEVFWLTPHNQKLLTDNTNLLVCTHLVRIDLTPYLNECPDVLDFRINLADVGDDHLEKGWFWEAVSVVNVDPQRPFISYYVPELKEWNHVHHQENQGTIQEQMQFINDTIHQIEVAEGVDQYSLMKFLLINIFHDMTKSDKAPHPLVAKCGEGLNTLIGITPAWSIFKQRMNKDQRTRNEIAYKLQLASMYFNPDTYE